MKIMPYNIEEKSKFQRMAQFPVPFTEFKNN